MGPPPIRGPFMLLCRSQSGREGSVWRTGFQSSWLAIGRRVNSSLQEKTRSGYTPILLGGKTSVKIDDRVDANQLDGRLLLQLIFDGLVPRIFILSGSGKTHEEGTISATKSTPFCFDQQPTNKSELGSWAMPTQSSHELAVAFQIVWLQCIGQQQHHPRRHRGSGAKPLSLGSDWAGNCCL